MYKGIINDLVGGIVSKGAGSVYPVFEHDGYEGIEIDEKNLSDIKNIKSGKTILFIDGGNNTIMSSFNFNLQYIRILGVKYRGNKRESMKRNDFYSLTTTKYSEGKILYSTGFYPIKEELFEGELEFDSMSEELKEGNFRVSVTKIANLTRRLAEIKLAERLIGELLSGDILVLDGSLMATTEIEKEFLNGLYEKAEEKKVAVVAVTKTTRIFTSTGASIIDALNSFKKDKWLYYPVFKITNPHHRAEMYFMKLHEKSAYIFRFEIYNKQKEKAQEIISLLANNSKDASLPGYPYGLVTADRFARVTNNEAEYFRTRFMAEAGLDLETIEKSMKSVDMHDRLDGI